MQAFQYQDISVVSLYEGDSARASFGSGISDIWV